MNRQQENIELRKDIRIARIKNCDLFDFKDIAEMLDMNINSFYNWLNSAYLIKQSKAKKLRNFLNDLQDCD